jgi:serine/threonine protein kinase
MVQSGDIVTLRSGHYRLREQLAGSSYGTVWRAERDGFGPVAIKLVNRMQMERAEPALRPRWSECAAREIAFLSALAPWDARHIVRLLDHGRHEGLPAMALELLDGDLAAHMTAQAAAGRRIGLPQALAWTGQVNAALAKVHQQGWRYLDLKPANLLVDTANNGLKLADFGTNRSLADTAAHSYAGTASWQAPEQFFPCPPGAPSGYLTDARADYFALGALFYYLVTDGATLRYCSACGDAFRAHGREGAMQLGGAPLPILPDDEAVRFLACAGDGDGSDGGAALTLLRALLARRPQDRPPHALAISRLITAAQGSTLRRAA